MTNDAVLLVLAVLGIPLFFLVLIVAGCLWERRLIQPYYVPNDGEEYEPSSIAVKANTQAERNGFHHCGLCHDGKGKLYRVRYDFWISSNNSTFGVVGSGTVANIPVNGVWLYSRTNDGLILCTTNEIGEQDISGAEEQVTWPHRQFGELFEKHSQRLTEHAGKPFDFDQPLVGFFAIRRSKADALVARNYAYYLDDQKMVWRFNLRGALAFYFISTWLRPISRFLRSLRLVRSMVA